MLNELKNLKYNGGKDELLFFICDVVGTGRPRIQDAEIICAHAPGKSYLSVKDLIMYCQALGWVQISEESITLSSSLILLLNDKERLNEALIISTVTQLFDENILLPAMFSYDAVQRCYAFKNELLPLTLSCIRNVLISQGFLIPQRAVQGSRFYISPVYDSLVAKHCKEKRKQMSLESLKKQIENHELAGEKAELFVMQYEQQRLGLPLCKQIKRISEIDVAAGYDIVSFESNKSIEPDRFIEVKAVSSSGFFWSKNEYEIAKLKGDQYFLYLVDLNKINQEDYSPLTVQNPAVNIMKSGRWLVEVESYLIRANAAFIV